MLSHRYGRSSAALGRYLKVRTSSPSPKALVLLTSLSIPFFFLNPVTQASKMNDMASPLSLFPQPQTVGNERPQLHVLTDPNKRPMHTHNQSSLVQAASYGMSGMAFEVTEGHDVSPMVIRSNTPYQRRTPTPPTRSGSTTDAGYRYRPRQSSLPRQPPSPHFSTPQRVPSHRLPHSSASIREQEAMRLSPLSFQAGDSRCTTPAKHHRHSEDRVDSPVQTQPMRSMFPQFQPGVPLQQQPYGPSHVLAPGLPRQQISKGASSTGLPLTIHVPERPVVAGAVLPPVLSKDESLRVWKLANGERGGRNPSRVQFDIKYRTVRSSQQGFVQPGLELDVTDGSGDKVYQARLAEEPVTNKENRVGNVTTQRFHPEEAGTFPVAQMECKLPPDDFEANDESGLIVASVFPQVAALNAIRAVADSLQARTIARFDPSASSPQAARLAFDAVQGAKEAEESNLIRRLTTAIGSSVATGTYELHHPSIGPLHMTVESGINLFDLGRGQPQRQGRIVLHGPSIQAGRTVDLASLDLANERLELNLAALCGDFDSLYMIDAAVSTLIAVAVLETLKNGGARTYFSAPPVLNTSTLAGAKPVYAGPPPSRKLTKSEKRAQKTKDADPDSMKLPIPIRALLKLLGFSFDAIVWVLGLGIKVLTKLLSCMSGGKH